MAFLRKLFLLDSEDEQDSQAEERARIEERLAEERALFEDRLDQERVRLKQEILQQVRYENELLEEEKTAQALIEMLQNEDTDKAIKNIAVMLEIESEILDKVHNKNLGIRLAKHLVKSPEMFDLVDFAMDGAVKEKFEKLSQDHSAKVEKELFDVFYKNLSEAAKIGCKIKIAEMARRYRGTELNLLLELSGLKSHFKTAVDATEVAYKELTSLGIDSLLRGDLLDVQQVKSPTTWRRAEVPSFSRGPFIFSSYRSDDKSSDVREEKTPPTPRVG